LPLALPLVLILGCFLSFAGTALIIHYWWVILLVIFLFTLLNIGEHGEKYRHEAGYYATRITGYVPSAYTIKTGWYMKVISPDGITSRIPISRAGCWVGRSRDCQIRLPDPTLSRKHCWVGLRGGSLQVRDANSSHGTQVNGKPVRCAYLQTGDEVRVGQSRLQIRRY
jgi:hypothetical protein